MRNNRFKRTPPPRRYTEDLVTIEPRKPLREILNSMLVGDGLEHTIREHKPLEPDGEDPNDFDSGTQEIVDLVDQQHLEEQIEELLDKERKAQLDQQQKQQQAEFDKAVEEAIAKRTQELQG